MNTQKNCIENRRHAVCELLRFMSISICMRFPSMDNTIHAFNAAHRKFERPVPRTEFNEKHCGTCFAALSWMWAGCWGIYPKKSFCHLSSLSLRNCIGAADHFAENATEIRSPVLNSYIECITWRINFTPFVALVFFLQRLSLFLAPIVEYLLPSTAQIWSWSIWKRS